MNQSQIYCISGDDEFRVSREAKRILGVLSPPEGLEHALETINGNASNVSEATAAIRSTIGALQEMGLFSSEKIVHLADANFLYDSRTGKSRDVKDQLSALADMIKAGLAGGTALIITCLKIDKRYALYKALKGNAEFSEFALPDKDYQIAQHVQARLQEAAKECDVRFNSDAVDAFVARVDADTRTIYSEVAKLRDYIGEAAEVHKDDVLEIVSLSRDKVAWDFADAVCRRDSATAISLLRQLLFQGEEPMALIMGLENRFRDLLVMRSAMDQGWVTISSSGRRESVQWTGGPEAETWLSSMGGLDPRNRHPFQQLQLARQAKQFRPAYLDRILKAVVETHESFMKSSLPPASLLETLVLRIMVRTSPRKKAQV